MVCGSLCSGGSFTIDLIFYLEYLLAPKGIQVSKIKVDIHKVIQVIRVTSKSALRILIKRQYLKLEACYINVR